MNTSYTAPIIRAFRQAPWRTQTQAVALWSVALLVIAVLGGIYLAVASRAGTAGRDVQDLEWRKAELTRSNDELRATLAQLHSVTRLADRARDLGFQAVAVEQVEYLPVGNYPVFVQTTTPAEAQVNPPATASISSWLRETLGGWLPPDGGGG